MQPLLVLLECGILRIDSREHLIERRREHGELAFRGHRCAHRDIALLRNRTRGIGERMNRPGNAVLKNAREKVCEQERGAHDERRDETVEPETLIHDGDVSAQIQRAEALILELLHRLEALEIVRGEVEPIGAGVHGNDLGRVVLRIAHENLAVLVIQHGGGDTGLGLERGEHLVGAALVAECERRRAVGRNDAREGRDVFHQTIARGQVLVTAEPERHQRDRRRARKEHDAHQALANRP